jgi:hypothetical protein
MSSIIQSIMPGADIKSLHVVSPPKGGIRKKSTRKKRSRKGGSIKKGVHIMGIPFEKSKPGLLDGRTCYKIGPFNWCKRK